MKSKAIPIIIIFSIILVLLSGCGQGTSGKTEATGTPGETETAVASEETEATVSVAETSTGFVVVDGILSGYSGTDSVVSIPDSVTVIGAYAFFECDSMTSVTIPDGVTTIGNGAFAACGNLVSIEVDSSNTSVLSVDDVLYNIDMTSLLCCSGGKTGEFAIPESITSISANAFYGCCSLTGVTIPDSVAEIGESVFSDCTGLTSVTIPDGVTTIGEGAFSGCVGLTSVTIPNSVTEIAERSENPIDLGDVVFTTYTTGAFEGCDSLTIYGETGSYAEQYAADNDIPFASN